MYGRLTQTHELRAALATNQI